MGAGMARWSWARRHAAEGMPVRGRDMIRSRVIYNYVFRLTYLM